MSVAKCPYCQQTIVGQIVAGDGGWTCPSCKRIVGTMSESRAASRGPRDAGATMVEGRPTPFKPEILRDATLNASAPLPPPEPVGGTVAAPKTTPAGAGPGGNDTLIGEVLGGCRILGVLGRGAMGTVYKATQLSLDRTVALKVIREELCTDEDLLARFEREAKLVGRFSTPHVVQIHDVGRERHVHFIVMEFVSGGSLLAHVNELPGRRLPPDVAIRYMIQAAEGLLEAERLQIVHRDIKPENILLDHAGRVKVADFGISRSITMNVELTATQAVLGTPLYMSPEQCRAEKLDHRSDMYSLGATFCHLLAGKRPLHEESVQELLRKKTTMEFLSPRKLAQDGSIPESLSRVIERMTALDRADRYPSFKDLLDDLHKVERGELIEPFQRSAARARLRRRLVKLAVTLVVLAGAGFGGYQGFEAWQRRQREELGGVPPVSTALTAAQLQAEVVQMRAKLREPALLTTALVGSAREKIRRAADGPDSEAAVALQALCDDGDRLVNYRESAELVRAAPYTPPFTELEARWKRLRELATAAHPEGSGAELRDFVGRDLESREKEEQGKAVGALATSLAALERQVKDGLAAADARRDARHELDAIVAGRGVVERLFPTAAGAAVAAAPDERTGAVRDALAKLDATSTTATEAPLAPAAAEKRLAELKQEFLANGPSRVMDDDAKAMRDRLPENSEVRTRVGDFLELVVRGNNVMLQLDALRNQQPPAVRPPFPELYAFAEKCRGAVHLDAADPDWYRGFFEPEPRRRLQPYAAGARSEFAALVARWRTAAGEITKGAGDASAFAQLHREVDDSRKNLKAAFGDASAFTAELLPDAEFTAAAQEFAKLDGLRQAAAGGFKDLDDAGRELDAVRSSAAWRERGAGQISPKLVSARKSIDAAHAADARTVDAATLARLAELEARAARWSDAVQKIDAAFKHLAGDHDLAAAKVALDGLGAGAAEDPTVKQAKVAVEQLQAGCHALFDDLDVGRARTAFGEAQRALADAAPTVTYAADCRARVDELEKVVATGMARVPAGRVKLAASIRAAKSSDTVDVAGFWLDACTVSIGEFQKFLADLPADKATVERLLPKLPGLAGSTLENALQRLTTPPAPLAAAKRPDPRLPIEQVSYAQAIVCLARHDKSLPTLEEWWLAAKGSLTVLSEHRRFPWSDSPTARLDQAFGTDLVCARLKRPMAVDTGGVAIGFGSVKVHHLSGNVEQWTQAVPAGGAGRLESRVVGGSYDDEEESRFSGEQPRYVDVTADPEFSTGFRGVVRPRDFFAAKGLAPKAF